ncbi:PAS domain-containing hybrid sensor histidine kinase/response regulator [Novosphingobium sp. KCTC 2891]|uniref:hybrid sensor histidine kinase/response regulator n=1 Tax=Novosphingobium sp. KCTC 2891 TaxID=2989730 RepID=UPI00222395AE|nr:PAS domain-containing hybrid sensor histidine kinase/response regulator [Novosphingobium sp. KCTC 2891]MCW1384953.1 PAS domain-containing hybrid sensor histidine kinase/response regulator [Novosphingobium sp. KCTC 2891]
MSLGLAALFALSLIVVLFAVAALVESTAGRTAAHPRLRHTAYTLGLGVYCSSWTFYGAVGSAVREGWNYLPIYLAPCLVMLLAAGFLRRLADAVHEEKATTISDFIAARYGHDPGMARLVTVIALCGIVPYGALQLRSIGGAIAIVSGSDVVVPVMVAASAVLALFAILFGARRYEAAGRNEGLLFSVALESIIKLVALVLVGLAAVAVIHSASDARFAAATTVLAARFSPAHLSLEFVVIGVISAMAIVALPRQFFMGLAEAQSPDDLPRARLGVAAYIAAMALLVLPIALAGLVALPGQVAPDLFVLALPEAIGARWIVTAALLGGISSAAAMVIVDSTALATMVSNDLIFPAVLRSEAGEPDSESRAGALGQRMLLVRRLAILAIVALSLAWALLLPARSSLASIGLVAFAAMAQFTPHLVLGVLRNGRDPLAGRLSLATGFALWLWTLALPPILPPAWLAQLSGTPFDPLRLLGIGHAPPLVHGVLWSLSANLAMMAAAAAGRDPDRSLPRLVRGQRPVRNLGELTRLAARFIGEERAAEAFPPADHAAPVDRASARRAQDLIAGVVGASSARALVASALAGGQLALADVTRLLDEGGQSLRFSRQLLAASFENLPSGISVIDADLNLVAWNTPYIEMFGYPPGFVRVGVPVGDLIRHNIVRGDFPGPLEAQVERRLRRLRARQPYVSERIRKDGRVIKSVGGPMPGGGYLTSFTDVTEEAHTRAELQHTLEQLETRVSERTRELWEANRRLAESTREKTRFLAAASHDLLQPLHAARLFATALDRQVGEGPKVLVARVERSIVAAENLLRALLDISKLDAGGIQPSPEPVALGPLLRDIAEGIRPLAEEKGLRLVIGPVDGAVVTDPGLLRSVLQNLLSNAVRYTQEGGILVGVRRRGGDWRIDVVDTGVGIPEDQQAAIFSEFTRLGEVEAEGLGLGLAIVERIARLLGLHLDLRSRPGHGSCFSVSLPAADPIAALPAEAPARAAAPLRPLTVLVVDNDPAIIDATTALLEAGGHTVRGAATIAQALGRASGVDVALIDYHLDYGEDGLDLVTRLREAVPSLPIALITAESGAELRARARRLGVAFFTKPVVPTELEAFLGRVAID